MISETKPDLSGRYYVDLFLNSPIGVFVVQDRQFQFVNPKFREISGYTEAELIGMESESIIFPEDLPAVKENAVKMLKGRISSPYLYRAVVKNGEIKWIIESVVSVNYRGNRAVLGYFMDNTEHERAKEAIRLSEDKFHKAFRSSPEWIVITTLEKGYYVDVNETFLKTTGYSRDEVIGSSAAQLGIWADPDQRDRMVGMLRADGKVRDLEAKCRMKSGEIRTMLWSAEIIDYGDERCVLAVTRDITDRILAEQERLQREKLQGALEMAGATCHELNQPLQGMYYLLDHLLEENPHDINVKELENQIDRMRNIIAKMNNITSYETKHYIRGSRIIDIEKASRHE